MVLVLEERFWQANLLREANHHFNTPEQTRAVRYSSKPTVKVMDESNACYESDAHSKQGKTKEIDQHPQNTIPSTAAQ